MTAMKTLTDTMTTTGAEVKEAAMKTVAVADVFVTAMSNGGRGGDSRQQ